MTTIVLRHGPCGENGKLTNDGILLSENKGAEIRKIIGEISAKQIIILSSIAPRALQTARYLKSGLGLPSNQKTYKLRELWNDDKHTANLENVMYYISQLPPRLALIIISHHGFVFPLAQKLGYNGEYQELPYLGQFVIGNEDSKADNIKKPELNLEYPLKLNIKIPVGNGRVFKIVEAISHLQKEKGWPISLNIGNGKKIMFVVPEIMPNGDVEKAMTGGYDKEGFFPVTVKTQGERFLKRFLDGKIDDGEMEESDMDIYINQLEGLKQFFLTFDNSINLDNWIIEE